MQKAKQMDKKTMEQQHFVLEECISCNVLHTILKKNKNVLFLNLLVKKAAEANRPHWAKFTP